MMKSIVSPGQLELTINRMARQIIENWDFETPLIIIGIQPRGIFFSDRIVEELKKEVPAQKLFYGKLDITFYRDDIRKELHIANHTDIPFSIDGKKIIIMDDVLYTGRTIRAALDALLDYGRPDKVELCILIDRKFSRQLPIQADYVGKTIDSTVAQKVIVDWDKKEVLIS